jgi:hypothetical protein
MRVFSIAATLFTLMSQASCSSGSQTFTIRTLAAGMHTTRSMPSKEVSLNQSDLWCFIRLSKASAIGCISSSLFMGVCMQISTVSVSVDLEMLRGTYHRSQMSITCCQKNRIHGP